MYRLLLLSLTAAVLFAQTSAGILGTVTDQTGAGLPGAAVTIRMSKPEPCAQS